MGRNAENKGRSPQRSRRKHCQSCQSLTRSGVGGGRRTQTVPTAQENKVNTAKVRHPAVGDITDCQDLDQEMLTAQGSPPSSQHCPEAVEGTAEASAITGHMALTLPSL